MSGLDTLINRFEGGSMTPDQMAQELRKLKQSETKEMWTGEPHQPQQRHMPYHQSQMVGQMAPGKAITERAPVGPIPGKGRGVQSQGVGTRTQAERDRARRYGFPPARLMVLVDGSENADKAIEAALHYRRRNDFLYFCTAVELGTDKQCNLELTNKAKCVIDDCKDIIKERELSRWETAILPATNPQQGVCDYAFNNNIDLVFIGTRGIDDRTHDFHPDSFSKHVLHNSHCSVMLIR